MEFNGDLFLMEKGSFSHSINTIDTNSLFRKQ